MNASRFDALARALASGASRRRVLKGLAGLASGGLLASPLLARAVGTPCEVDTDCPGDEICFNGSCQALSGCVRGQACLSDATCCVGEICCGGSCVTGTSCADAAGGLDPDRACLRGQVCQGDDPCCPGESCCGDICIQGLSCEDPGSCRADGECDPGAICVDGYCQLIPAPPVQVECAPNALCSSDLDCVSGQQCVGGVCQQVTGPAVGVVCQRDADCGANAICVDGTCRRMAASTAEPGTVPDTDQTPVVDETPDDSQPDGDAQTPVVTNTPVGGQTDGGDQTPDAAQTPVGGQTGDNETPVAVDETPAADETPDPEATSPVEVTPPPDETTAADETAEVDATATGVGAAITPANPAAIRSGTCGSQSADATYRLFDVRARPEEGTPTAGGPLGSPAAIPTRMSVTLLDVSIADLLGGENVIDIRASGDDLDTVITCGDIGGELMGRDLSIGLREVDGSGFSGIAWLRDQGENTLVYVFLAPGLSSGG